MIQLSVNGTEVSKEYLDVLEKVLNIRKERRSIYGDCFLSEKFDSILNIIDGKRRRCDSILQKKEKSDLDKAKIEDELLDIINYYIFLICVLK